MSRKRSKFAEVFSDYSKQKQPAQKQSGRDAIPATDFKTVNKKKRFLWYPYLPIGDYSVLTASSGAGKTILCCGIAAAISTGNPIPGEQQKRAGKTVLIISAKDNGDILKERLEHSGADLRHVFIIDRSASLGMDFSKHYKDFKNTIQSVNPDLVIIDPWHAFLGEKIDMNRVNVLRPILQKLSNMATECHCALLLTAHTSPRLQNETTGLTDLISASRSVLQILFDESSNNSGILVHTKANYTPYGKSIRYHIQKGGLVWDGLSNVNKQTLELAEKQGLTPNEIIQKNHPQEERYQALIDALKDAASQLEKTRFTYAAFTANYGTFVFGNTQPKRALDAVKTILEQEGYDLKTGIQVRYNGKKDNGFQIQFRGNPEIPAIPETLPKTSPETEEY